MQKISEILINGLHEGIDDRFSTPGSRVRFAAEDMEFVMRADLYSLKQYGQPHMQPNVVILSFTTKTDFHQFRHEMDRPMTYDEQKAYVSETLPALVVSAIGVISEMIAA